MRVLFVRLPEEVCKMLPRHNDWVQPNPYALRRAVRCGLVLG